MSGEVTEFLTDKPGEQQFRVVDPVGFLPPDGVAALVLGVDSPGAVQRFNVGDKVDVYQAGLTEAGKILRFKGRLRGPSRMPMISGVEPFTISSGQSIKVRVDYGAVLLVPFVSGDFDDISNIPATELRDVVNSKIPGVTATITGTGEIAVFSDRTDRRNRVEFVGANATGFGFGEARWRAGVYVDGVLYSSRYLLPGYEHDVSDMAVNLAFHTPSSEIRFSLELVKV